MTPDEKLSKVLEIIEAELRSVGQEEDISWDALTAISKVAWAVEKARDFLKESDQNEDD